MEHPVPPVGAASTRTGDDPEQAQADPPPSAQVGGRHGELKSNHNISVADPYFFEADPDPGKNLHADPGGKGKRLFFFFTFWMILKNVQKGFEFFF